MEDDMEQSVQIAIDSTNPHAAEILAHFENCAICGTKLRFTHRTDYLKFEVEEEASCPQCGIQNKVAKFILQ
jgi:hypothetical protein